MEEFVPQYHLREILKKYWGYEHFRPLQEEIIASVYEGHDTLGLLPTGGGKSITYQVAGLARGGLTLVITPLIALMEDQLANLSARGIRATAIHSGLWNVEIARRFDGVLSGAYSFLYLSPERLAMPSFLDAVAHWGVRLVAVDEAHCISQWGHDFRPQYRNIDKVRELLYDVPFLAVTATATSRVLQDIVESLTLRSPRRFCATFQREGLQYAVRESANQEKNLLQAFSQVNGAGIVYVRQRQRTQEIANLLNEKGIKATFYHAALSPEVRKKRQEAWMAGEQRVMVATNAFGMGIDKPDVRLVCHLGLPTSLEEYYQEAGRGGRDGKGALAFLLYEAGEIAVKKRQLAEQRITPQNLRAFYAALRLYCDGMVHLPPNNAVYFDFEEFLITQRPYHLRAMAWLRLLENSGYIYFAQPMRPVWLFALRVSRSEIEEVRERSEDADRFFQLLLGQVAEQGYYSLAESRLERAFYRQKIAWRDLVANLARRGYIRYVVLKQGVGTLSFLSEDDSLEDFDFHYWKKIQRWTEERYEAMVDYVTHHSGCRELILRRYFGETLHLQTDACHRCDLCLLNEEKEA